MLFVAIKWDKVLHADNNVVILIDNQIEMHITNQEKVHIMNVNKRTTDGGGCIYRKCQQ